jgi:ferredoxin-type protein NapH
MNLSNLRWTILTVSFFLLLFGAYLGLYFGYFLPTFSCCYVRARAGTCFMLTLQQTLGTLTWDTLLVFLERLLYFSLLVIVIGRAWCGWICPLAFFQDVMDLIRKKIGIGYIRFSEKLRDGLAWIKWAFLSIALLLPIWVAFPLFCPCVALDLRLPFCQICPGKYILPLLVGNPDRVAADLQSVTRLVMSTLGLTFSALTIIGSFIKRRFWCIFCPLGLILSWYRKISFLKLEKNDEKCTKCEICYNVCPVEIEAVYKSQGRKDVTFAECSLCLKCIENCPEENALKAVYLGKTIYRSSPRTFFENRGVAPEDHPARHA